MNRFATAIRGGKAKEIDQVLQQAGSQKSQLLGQDAQSGKSLLGVAVENGKEEVVKVLLRHGANVNERDRDQKATPLINAICHSHEETFQVLLEDPRVNVNLADKDGQTPLHWAIQLSHESWAHALINKGANVAARDIHRRTPLHLAAAEGTLGIIKELGKTPSLVNSVDNHHQTPLFYAVQGSHLQVATLLLEMKALPNLDDDRGNTPLHFAAQKGSFALMEPLLRAGAHPLIQNSEGLTAAQVFETAGGTLTAEQDALIREASLKKMVLDQSPLKAEEEETGEDPKEGLRRENDRRKGRRWVPFFSNFWFFQHRFSKAPNQQTVSAHFRFGLDRFGFWGCLPSPLTQRRLVWLVVLLLLAYLFLSSQSRK